MEARKPAISSAFYTTFTSVISFFAFRVFRCVYQFGCNQQMLSEKFLKPTGYSYAVNRR